MKLIIGLGMILAGIILGLYIGIWICFIGGTVDIIEQIQASKLNAMAIAIGITKVFFAGLFGWLSGTVLVLIGCYILIKAIDDHFESL